MAIGQKASSIAATVDTLRQHGALDYTVVVVASASDSAAMRYYSPFAGVAIGEYIRDTGRDALIIMMICRSRLWLIVRYRLF